MSLRVTPSRSLFFIPALILLITFVVYPLVATILFSFNVNAIVGASLSREKPVGLDNYAALINSDALVNAKNMGELKFPMGALIHNVLWIAIHLPLTLLIGIVFAAFLQYVKGGMVIRSIMFLGMVIPMVVGGLLILFSFDKDVGAFNLILQLMGLEQLKKTWTAYPDTALFSLILGAVWLWSGFAVTVYSAGISSLPREIIEAAVVDGARFRDMLFKVIVPMLKPVTLTVAAMTIIWDLKIFDIVYVATGGGPGGASMVLAVLMYDYFARALNYNMAAAVATILTIVILPPAIIWIRSVMRG